MNAGTITQEALNDYRSAIKSWLTLRNTQSTYQLRLAALLNTEEKPAAYASQLEELRERLAVLEWQINCAARDGLYAHQIVLESCVTSATENFMSEHGDALTDALAPFLCAPYGLEAAMKILRTHIQDTSGPYQYPPFSLSRLRRARKTLCCAGVKLVEASAYIDASTVNPVSSIMLLYAAEITECGTVAHARTSAYEAPSVKRSWYQCQNLECSCTFTALESVDTIIMKPWRNEQESDKEQMPEKQQQTLNRYGSASKLSSRQLIPV